VSISIEDKTSKFSGSFSPEYPLLGLLTQQPAHGYDLHHKLAQDLGEVWHISLSQTYNVLNRLEAQGFIQGSVEEQEKLPARRRFTLTTAGRERFNAWLNAPSRPTVRATRVEFTTRLYFARAINKGLAQRLIDEQIAETRAGMARLQLRLGNISPEQIFNRIGLELRIRQLNLICEWLGSCYQVLEDT
jgi:DNA-binding PadR family transcriptional regulator